MDIRLTFCDPERKKAMRLAKQLQTKIEKSTDPEEKEQLRRELHVAQVDEAYALHHPHAEPYISLYVKPKASRDKDDEPSAAKGTSPESERPPMWETIEKAMEEGPRALKQLRERRSPDNGESKVAKRTVKQQPTHPVRKPAQAQKSESQSRNNAGRPAASAAQTKSKDQAPQMNRRERRRLMHQNKQAAQQSEDEDDGEGFFDM